VIAARNEVDGTGMRLAWKICGVAALAWLLLVLCGFLVGPEEAAGAALGGAIILSLFALHLGLARSCLRPGKRAGRVSLWVLCFVKWPLVVAALFFAIRSGVVAPVWVCIGASVVPVVATITGLYMLRHPARPGGPE